MKIRAMTMTQTPGPALSRRRLVASISMLALTMAAGPIMLEQAAAAAVDDDTFLDVSEFVIGRKLDPVLSRRYLAALSESDPGFQSAIMILRKAIAPVQTQGIDALLATLQHSDPLLASIQTITSAWYLGVVGTGRNAQLIAFYDALMFAPTRDYVFVPTYGGGPDSWVAETHPSSLSANTKG